MAEILKTWRTIQTGTFKLREDLSKALGDSGYRVEEHAPSILEKMDVALEPTEVDLVLVTPSKLGFSSIGASLQVTYNIALSRGLELCSAEDGPQLRLQYPHQPRDEWIRIAMEPVLDSDGHPRLFYVINHKGVLCLHTYWCSTGDIWSGNDLFAFVRPK